MCHRLSYWAIACGLALLITCSIPAWAGGGEIAGFGGLGSVSDGGGNHPSVGGSAAFTSGRIRVFGEGSYTPMGSESETTYYQGYQIKATASMKMISAGGGLSVDVISPGERKAVPYLLGSFGYGRQILSGHGSATGTSISVDLSEAANYGYAGFGGGVRLYAGKSWGLKPEFRYQRYFGADNSRGTILFLTAGIFYEFGK